MGTKVVILDEKNNFLREIFGYFENLQYLCTRFGKLHNQALAEK